MNRNKNRNLGITYIDGEAWLVSLPDGGSTLAGTESSEFARMVDLVGEDAFHCEMSTWCFNYGVAERFEEEEGYYWSNSGYVRQYDGKRENWNLETENYRGYSTGFRPILTPVNGKTLRTMPSRISHLKDGESIALGTLYMNGEPLKNPKEAKKCLDPGWYPGLGGDIPRYSENVKLAIGDTSSNEAFQIKFIKFGNLLVSDRVLIGCISLRDLEDRLVLENIPVARRNKKASLSLKIQSAETQSINGVSAGNPDVKQTVLVSDDLRKQTLNICHSIPGYSELGREDANTLYDLVKKAVSASLLIEKKSVPER